MVRTCLICRFETEDDDVAEMGYQRGTCICVGCWHRQTDDAEHLASAAVNGNTPLAKEVRRLLGVEGKQ